MNPMKLRMAWLLHSQLPVILEPIVGGELVRLVRKPAGERTKQMKIERKRILVVDDDPAATTLLQLYLEKSIIYEVKVENASTQALAVAEQFRPDLIFLDVDMPGISGGELASSFNASPRLRGVPVVFLTAMVTKEEVRARGGMIGHQPFLAKPVTRRDVLDCVVEHLGIDAICKRGVDIQNQRILN